MVTLLQADKQQKKSGKIKYWVDPEVSQLHQ